MKNSISRRSFIKKSSLGALVATNAALVSGLISAMRMSEPDPECTPDNNCMEWNRMRSSWSGWADTPEEADAEIAKIIPGVTPPYEKESDHHVSEAYLSIFNPPNEESQTISGHQLIENGRYKWAIVDEFKITYCGNIA